MQKTIRQIFEQHNGKLSDKWTLYLGEWDRLFSPYRDLQIRLLEIGIQNGGSLEVFGKYFSRAEKIIGCDIDPKCENLWYDDGRIAVVVGDANSSGSESEILRHAPAFDIIIDDGSHKSGDIVRSFARYFPHVSDGGIYIVEDLHSSYWKDYEGGLNDPLSAMGFLKRLADIVNYEHWRNNKPRWSLLKVFAKNLGIEFEEIELTKIHSIEFVNSLCIIKKLSPEKNVLGNRIIVGNDEYISSGWKKLHHTVIQDFAMDIKDDANLDVFELIARTNSLSATLSDRDAQLQEITGSKVWRVAMLLRRARVLLLPPGSWRARMARWTYLSLKIWRREGFATLRRKIMERLTKPDVDLFLATNIDQLSGANQLLSVTIKKTEDGLFGSPAGISVILETGGLPSALSLKAVEDWLEEQTCPFVDLIIWDRKKELAFEAKTPLITWAATDLIGVCRGLSNDYFCMASRDLLDQPPVYLETNLIALKSENLVFTINIRKGAEWIITVLLSGRLPGSKASPLLRMVVHKNYLYNEGIIDLSDWGVVPVRCSASVVGRLLLQTTNQIDDKDSIQFEGRLINAAVMMAGQRVVAFPKDEIPTEKIAHTISPVNMAVPVQLSPSELPTVILVIQFLAVGGAERLALNLIRTLSQSVRFVVVGIEPLDAKLGTMADEFRQATPYVYTLPDFLDYNLTYFFLGSLIERYQAAGLYIANGCNFIYDVLCKLHGIYPDLRITNQVYDHQFGWINRYTPEIAKAIQGHIAANTHIQKAYIERGANPDEVFFLEHGIDIQELDPTLLSSEMRFRIRQEMGVPSGVKLVSFIARLHPQKRPMDFLEMARRFQNDASVHFLMVGDGPLAKTVGSQAVKSGLRNFHLHSFYKPISNIYAISDVLVLPSEYEALPLVVLEAQAMGCPVVVTDVGSLREVVGKTGGGIVVDKIGDVSALTVS